MFKANSLYYADGYKPGHKRMAAPGMTYLYGSWIPRSTKHAPEGIDKVVSAGQQLVWMWIHDEYTENFFALPLKEALKFQEDMSKYLGMPYDASHFEALHKLGYLPMVVKALPEGIETPVNVPHMTFINTVEGFGWLTLYLETIVSALAWKTPTSATLALKYKRNAVEWVTKTDVDNLWLTDYMCHDFSARGLDPWSMISSGLGHAMSHRGSDSLIVIPASRYFYGVPEDEVCINSVNASEHSVSTTKIFTVGEKQMLIDWLIEFPIGILSVVADTFDLWKLLLEYLTDPEVKALILARDGKLVIRPDSGDPVDIICGKQVNPMDSIAGDYVSVAENKGVIEILWDIFGGDINSQGYKRLNSHIGAIYGDSINLARQINIYKRLADKGFASTNIVLGVGSFTYQFNSRDTLGWAAKGCWFEVRDIVIGKISSYDIFKDPITDDGTKKSLKGLLRVNEDLSVTQQCSKLQETEGLLQVIYNDGDFFNQVTLSEIRERLNKN